MYVSGCDKNAYNVSSFAAWKIADEKVLRGVISAQRANRQVGRTEKLSEEAVLAKMWSWNSSRKGKNN